MLMCSVSFLFFLFLYLRVVVVVVVASSSYFPSSLWKTFIPATWGHPSFFQDVATILFFHFWGESVDVDCGCVVVVVVVVVVPLDCVSSAETSHHRYYHHYYAVVVVGGINLRPSHYQLLWNSIEWHRKILENHIFLPDPQYSIYSWMLSMLSQTTQHLLYCISVITTH